MQSISEVLDPVHLSAQTFGDRALEGELLVLFEEQCRRLLPAIAGENVAMARGDAAHTLKGGAQAVGARRIAALAASVELALEQAEADEMLKSLVEKLQAAVREVEVAIARRRQDVA